MEVVFREAVGTVPVIRVVCPHLRQVPPVVPLVADRPRKRQLVEVIIVVRGRRTSKYVLRPVA